MLPPRTPRFIIKSLLSLHLCAAPVSSRGEARLLTGDAAGNLHQQSATVMDLSGDGDLLLFSSGPPVSGSTPGIAVSGLYQRRISAGTLTFVSGAPTGPVDATMSNDGRYLAWRDGDGMVFWRDVQANVTRPITSGADGVARRPVISGDGRYVAYASVSRNIVANPAKLQPAQRPGVYLYDSQTTKTNVVTLTPSGDALNTGLGASGSVATAGNEFDLSADGKYIVYATDAANASPDRPANYTAGFLCVYRRNLATGVVELLNRNAAGAVSDGNYSTPRVSGDGSRTAFYGAYVGTFAGVKMIASVTNGFGSDLYVKEVPSGTVWWASKTVDNSVSDGAYGPIALSDDGGTVAFASSGTKFVSGNTDAGGGNSGTMDIFRADLGAAGAVTTSHITVSPAGKGNVDYRFGPLLPGTGDYVVFSTSQVAAMMGTGNQDTINYQGFGVGTLPAAPSGPSYTQWAAGLPAGKQGYNDNPAGDGVPNLTKFFMGMNPATADISRLPARGVKTGVELGIAGDNRSYLTLTVRILRNLPAGFTWKVRAAATLAGLAGDTAGSAVQAGAPAADGDYDVYLFRHPQPLNGQGFMDVKLSAP